MKPGLSFDIGGFRTDVFLGDQVSVGPAFAEASAAGPVVTVFDSTTFRLFGQGAPNPVVLDAGEHSKRWDSAERILSQCASLGMGRDGTILGVGGGVVCDIAAFSASLYMRGCGLWLFPTTLLAMVDASLGGKTGMDFLGFKNLVGTFYPASRLLVDMRALRDLPDREYLSGIAEALKTALIGDRDLWTIMADRRKDVLARDPRLLLEIVQRCLAVKGRIVAEDPRETGELRAILNLGHTFGHALESATGLSVWTHGEAVAWGIARAAACGVKLGVTEAPFARQLATLLRAYDFRLDADIDSVRLTEALLRDKKRRGGKARLVIPRGPGSVVVREESDGVLAEALTAPLSPGERSDVIA